MSHLIGYIKRHLKLWVHRIMNGKRPCKSNRPKERAKILDDFDHCVIKKNNPRFIFTENCSDRLNNT